MVAVRPLFAGMASACALIAGTPAAAAVAFSQAQLDQAKAALASMSGLNLIALGNWSGGHDVEGKAFVGGNMTGNSSSVGIGAAANGQSAVANNFATLTVGGSNLTTVLNLDNGRNASNVYGAVIGGDTGKINFNGSGAIVKVGGNAAGDFTVNNKTGGAATADISIRGYVGSITATGAGVKVAVGSLSGGSNKVEVGNDATVSISSGGATLVKAGTGATIKVGGSVSDQVDVGSGNVSVTGNVNLLKVAGTSNTNSTVAVGGAITNQIVTGQRVDATVTGATRTANLGSQSTLRVGGALGGLDIGTRSSATITGNLGDGQNATLNFNGSNAEVRIGGQFTSQNVNALNNSNAVIVSGANLSQNGAPKGWTFGTGTTYAAPAPPSAPAQPDVPVGPQNMSLSSITTTLTDNLTTLSTMLGAVRAEAFNTAVLSGGTYTFTIANNAKNAQNGYVAFNVGTDIFSASNIDFNFGNVGALPVIINVRGMGAGTYEWLGNARTGNSSAVNQNVIWNFVGATGNIDFKRIIHGSVLAPNATVSNNTPIEGSVAVKNFNAGGEVHLGTFNGASGFLTYEVFAVRAPEPATWMQMVLGFGFAGFALRRRRRIIPIAA